MLKKRLAIPIIVLGVAFFAFISVFLFEYQKEENRKTAIKSLSPQEVSSNRFLLENVKLVGIDEKKRLITVSDSQGKNGKFRYSQNTFVQLRLLDYIKIKDGSETQEVTLETADKKTRVKPEEMVIDSRLDIECTKDYELSKIIYYKKITGGGQ